MATPSHALNKPGEFYTFGAMQNRYWYDAIIDDMLANPGTTAKDTALRLGKHASTISIIINSDLFKARYEARREAFNLAIQERISGKLTEVAEKGLDAIIENLNSKRDKIPFALLESVTKTALDRLGYAPSRSESPQVQVNVQQNAAAVSSEGLAKARELQRAAAKQVTILDGIPITKEEPPLGEGGSSSEEV